MTRHLFELTDDALCALIKVCVPVPYIALQCGEPRSTQARVNDAWDALGKKMGFDGSTVKPCDGQGPKVFTAVPVEEETP